MRHKSFFFALILVACESPDPETSTTSVTGSENCAQVPYYRDADADGFGTPNEQVASCTRPSGYASNSDDCDDSDPDTNPNSRWYRDDDGDGFGDDDQEILQCDGPIGYVLVAGDCDDTDPTINGDTIWYKDADGDTYGDPNNTYEGCNTPADFVLDSTDCDDTNDLVSPDSIWYADADADGYGDPTISITQCDASAGHVADNTDCDDGNIDAYPGATWYLDSDADGYGTPAFPLVQCEEPVGFVADKTDCDDFNPSVNPGTLWFEDLDGDGFGNPAVSIAQCVAPGAHVTNDEDCDDTNDALSDNTVWYTDGDSDGYGSAIAGSGCTGPALSVLTGGDCNDNNALFSPGQTELCDGLDNDCEVSSTEFETVSFETSGGTWTDESPVFNSGTQVLPAAWSSSVAGTLHVCEGEYRVQLDLTQDIVIAGAGELLAIFNGSGARTILNVAGANVEVHGMTLKNGDANPSAGGLVSVNNGTVRVADSNLTGDTSWTTSVFVENNSTFTLERSIIRASANTGLIADASEVHLVNSEITGNSFGSVFASNGSLVTLTDSLIHNHNVLTATARMSASDFICTATTVGTFGFIDNHSTLPGGTFEFIDGATLTSNGCDWGSGIDDNSIDDFELSNVVFNYENDANFTCDATSQSCVP